MTIAEPSVLRITSHKALHAAEAACTRCPLYKNATQAVPGEGPARAWIMMVGEQPADQEDRQGKPLVGPAGRVLDEAIHESGLDRATLFVTNAVKHFKFEQRGKRRLHKRPDAYEIDRCHIWIEQERALVKPALIVALGVTAARRLPGMIVTISKMRGDILDLTDGARGLVTIHPSWLLRMDDDDRKCGILPLRCRSANGAAGRAGTVRRRADAGTLQPSTAFAQQEAAMNVRPNPPQEQKRQPGREARMVPQPDCMPRFPGADRLKDKVALITGGDSGIGRATAIAMAREGADIAIVYLEEHKDAGETLRLVREEGAEAIKIAGDIGDEAFCEQAVDETIETFGRLDILVNNAAEQHETDEPLEIPAAQLEKTFRTNVFGFFYMTKAALRHMDEGASIVNTTSITAYRGHETLIDYASTKGAIVAFTRSLSQALVEKGIRVNAVAPGPIWTPLIPASFDAEKTAEHGGSAPMKRPGQPNEVAPCFVFLASDEASYMTGQVLHPNGGSILNT